MACFSLADFGQKGVPHIRKTAGLHVGTLHGSIELTGQHLQIHLSGSPLAVRIFIVLLTLLWMGALFALWRMARHTIRTLRTARPTIPWLGWSWRSLLMMMHNAPWLSLWEDLVFLVVDMSIVVGIAAMVIGDLWLKAF